MAMTQSIGNASYHMRVVYRSVSFTMAMIQSIGNASYHMRVVYRSVTYIMNQTVSVLKPLYTYTKE